MRVPPLAFFITKYFGSGVIIATAFIHVSISEANLRMYFYIPGAIPFVQGYLITITAFVPEIVRSC